jgi:hypothetical protein
MPLFAMFLLGGLFVALVGIIWGAVLAFRTTVWWGVVYILVPLGWPIFLIAHLNRTWKPALITLCGIGLVAAGVTQAPNLAQAAVAHSKRQIGAVATVDLERQTQLEQQRAQLQDYKAQAEQRYVELTKKRAATKPDDDDAILAFNEEVIQYNALLERIKALEAKAQTTN